MFPLGTSAAAAALPGRPLLAVDGAMAPAACEEDFAADMGDDSSSAPESDMDADPLQDVDSLQDGDTHLLIQGEHTVTACRPLCDILAFLNICLCLPLCDACMLLCGHTSGSTRMTPTRDNSWHGAEAALTLDCVHKLLAGVQAL